MSNITIKSVGVPAIDISEKEVTSHGITTMAKTIKRVMEKFKQPTTKMVSKNI